jgi:hypothetical protein
MIKISQQPDIFASANTPVKYKVHSDNLQTHYSTPYQYRYEINYNGYTDAWTIGDTFTLNVYFNDNGKPLSLKFIVGPATGPDPYGPNYRFGYIVRQFESMMLSTSQLVQDLSRNSTLNAYVDVERIIVGDRYFIVFTPKTADIAKVEFVTTNLTDFNQSVAPISNVRDNYKIVAELIAQRYEENLTSRYDTIHSSFAYLNADNEAVFDFSTSISEVLSTCPFDNFFQSLISENSAQSWRGELKFGIHVYETWIDADGKDVIGDHLMSSYSSILQGGLQGVDQLLGLNIFDIHDDSNLLSYQPRTKVVSKEDIDFLPFFLKDRNSTVVTKVTLKYSNGTSDIQLISESNSRNSSVFIVPSGYHQLNIDSYVDALKELVSYKVELQTSGELSLSESVEFLIDYKYYEKNNSFIYLNSLGVPEAINLKGVKTTTSEVERKILRMPEIDGKLSQFAHLVTPSNKLAAGNHFSKTMFKSIDELVASNQTYEVMNGLISPIVINNKNTTEYTEKNNILEFVLDYAPAIKGGVMLSEFYKRLSLNRSTCIVTHSISEGTMNTGEISVSVEGSYDSEYSYLDDDAEIEYTITLLRPLPITIVIKGEYNQTFSSSYFVKLLEVGLERRGSATGPERYNTLDRLIKNFNNYDALAFPIQVSCRVRQKSINDEWSLPVIVTFPALELTSMYRPIQDMQKWQNYIFGVHPGCVFMVDERGRRTTIAGTLNFEYAPAEGINVQLGTLTSIAVDDNDIRFGFPTLYVYEATNNRICKIYLTELPIPIWYCETFYTYPDYYYRMITIHPTLRYSGNNPVILISKTIGGSIGALKSTISSLDITTMTETIVVNTMVAQDVADGGESVGKSARISSIKWVEDNQILITESGSRGTKTSIVRLALVSLTGSSTSRIAQINNPANWTLKTIAGAGSVVSSHANLNDNIASGKIILGSSAASMRLYNVISGAVKVGDDYYIAAGLSNVVLKLTKQEDIVGYEPFYYNVEIVTGKSDEAGFYYDIPEMTLLNQPLAITADEEYLYISQNVNGQILKISLKDYTTSVFSGEGTYTTARDWGIK